MLRLVLPSGAIVKSTPVPVSWRVWGEFGELSVMARVPVRGPPVVGVKATWRVQAAPTARVVPQLFVPATMAKSPVMFMLWSWSGRPPLLVRVTVCALGR